MGVLSEEFKALVQELQALGVAVSATVEIGFFSTEPPEDDDEEKPVDPPAVVLKSWMVTAEKTLAHMETGANQAGYPVLEVYEATKGNVKTRIRFDRGAVVKVYPTLIRADGGYQWYVLEQKAADGRALYVYSGDGKLL